jgi:Ca2+/Na+ antiporter
MNPQVVNPERTEKVEEHQSESLDHPTIRPSNHSSNITVISMAIFVLACLVVVGFLYYQNQELKSMLANYQTKPTASPTPTATTDPTASWQTYINKKGNFSFKYPDNVTAKDQIHIPNMVGIGMTNVMNAFNNAGGSSGSPYFMDIEYNLPLNDNYAKPPSGVKVDSQQEINLGGKKATQYLYEVTELQEGYNVGDKFERVVIKNDSSSIGIELSDYTQHTLFDQILSTFQFISSSPMPSEIPISTPSAVPVPAGY